MRILSELITRHVDNDRFVQIYGIPFIYESDLLAKWGFDPRVEIHVDFVQDFESMSFLRGRNKRGGTVHDFFSCYDSVPVVTKQQAADLYAEMNKYTDSIDHGRGLFTKMYDWLRRHSKSSVVRFWPCYFHKRSIFATALEIAGVDGDPYVTIEEKIEEIITKTEAVSEDIKQTPDVHAPEIADKIDKVTEDLKDAKKDVQDKL